MFVSDDACGVVVVSSLCEVKLFSYGFELIRMQKVKKELMRNYQGSFIY
jgi:hypothetical protein